MSKNLPAEQIPIDESKVKLFFLALETGVFIGTALAYATISDDEFAAWVAVGRANAGTPYADFVTQLDIVMARAEMQLVYAIRDHFERPGGWQAAAWLLKARYPARWGSKSTPPDEDKPLGKPADPSDLREIPNLTDSQLEDIIRNYQAQEIKK